MAFKDHFSQLATQYAAYRPRYPDALFAYLAKLSPSIGCAWDCACGSGQASVALAAHFERVIATDASAQQIAAATSDPRVTYRVAAAERSGLDDETIDLVTVAQALHWFDLDAFYREAGRVLRAGGVLAAWSYGVAETEDSNVNGIMERFYEALDPWWPPERSLVENGYRTLAFPFDEISAPRFEIQEHWSLAQLLGYFSSWSAVGRYIADRGDDPLAPLRRELQPVWGDPEARRTVIWPLALRISRRAR